MTKLILGRWMVPMDEYFEEFFPPYCSGGHYFLSNQAAQKIYDVGLSTDNFRFQDVHLSGILRSEI